MPRNYKCSPFDLEFSIGWFHYHDFTSGYGSETLLICDSCGTEHTIQIAMSDRGQEFYYDWQILILDVPNETRTKLVMYLKKLLGLELKSSKELLKKTPIILEKTFNTTEKDKVLSSLTGIGVTCKTELFTKTRNESYGPILKDLLKGRKGNEWIEQKIHGETQGQTQQFDLSKQKCMTCHQVGTLRSELPENYSTCPCCKQQTLVENGGYVT